MRTTGRVASFTVNKKHISVRVEIPTTEGVEELRKYKGKTKTVSLDSGRGDQGGGAARRLAAPTGVAVRRQPASGGPTWSDADVPVILSKVGDVGEQAKTAVRNISQGMAGEQFGGVHQ